MRRPRKFNFNDNESIYWKHSYQSDGIKNLKSKERRKHMAKSSGLKNAPSTTGNPSGKGRGNNPPKSGK